MHRNLKILTLALAAIFALTAVAASAASAHEITAGAYTATVSGEQVGANTLSNGVREVTCSTASLTGTLTAASPSITITPAYSNCTGNAGTTATVDMNGCTYVETPTNTSGIANNESTTINCPTGQAIEYTIWASGKAHTEPRLCTLKVGSQGPITTGVKSTNRGGFLGRLRGLAITVLRIVRVLGTAANCGAEEKTTGTYTGEIIETAKHEGVTTSLDAN